MARMTARIQVCSHDGSCVIVKNHAATVEGSVVEIHIDDAPELLNAIEDAADEVLEDE